MDVVQNMGLNLPFFSTVHPSFYETTCSFLEKIIFLIHVQVRRSMLGIGWTAQPIDADGPLAEGMGRTMIFHTLMHFTKHYFQHSVYFQKIMLFEQAHKHGQHGTKRKLIRIINYKHTRNTNSSNHVFSFTFAVDGMVTIQLMDPENPRNVILRWLENITISSPSWNTSQTLPSKSQLKKYISDRNDLWQDFGVVL